MAWPVLEPFPGGIDRGVGAAEPSEALSTFNKLSNLENPQHPLDPSQGSGRSLWIEYLIFHVKINKIPEYRRT